VHRRPGEVRCWGDNRYGQLGRAPAAQAAEPVEVVGGHTWSALAAGGSHVCGLEGGDVLCWGSTTSGQANGVAAGTSNAPCGAFAGLACDVLAPTPLRLAGPARELRPAPTTPARSATRSRAGATTARASSAPGACRRRRSRSPARGTSLLPSAATRSARSRAGQTYCWGSTGAAASQAPTHIVELDGAQVVNASATIGSGSLGHACYLDRNRELFCVGDNTRGQFGNGVVTGLACGNAVCDAGETSATCSLDCGAPPMTRSAARTARSASRGSPRTARSRAGSATTARIECWGRNRGAVITTAIDPATGQPVDYVYTPTVIGGLSAARRSPPATRTRARCATAASGAGAITARRGGRRPDHGGAGLGAAPDRDGAPGGRLVGRARHRRRVRLRADGARPRVLLGREPPRRDRHRVGAANVPTPLRFAR
jgi:hypothetical protein